MANDYLPGDTLGLRFPMVDRINMSQKIMPCTFLEKTHSKYKLSLRDSQVVLRFEALKDLDHKSLNTIAFTKAVMSREDSYCQMGTIGRPK